MKVIYRPPHGHLSSVNCPKLAFLAIPARNCLASCFPLFVSSRQMKWHNKVCSRVEQHFSTIPSAVKERRDITGRTHFIPRTYAIPHLIWLLEPLFLIWISSLFPQAGLKFPIHILSVSLALLIHIALFDPQVNWKYSCEENMEGGKMPGIYK